MISSNHKNTRTRMFLEKMEILNDQFLNTIRNFVDQVPSCDLSPTVNDYLKHVDSLDKLYGCMKVARETDVHLAPAVFGKDTEMDGKPVKGVDANGKASPNHVTFLSDSNEATETLNLVQRPLKEAKINSTTADTKEFTLGTSNMDVFTFDNNKVVTSSSLSVMKRKRAAQRDCAFDPYARKKSDSLGSQKTNSFGSAVSEVKSSTHDGFMEKSSIDSSDAIATSSLFSFGSTKSKEFTKEKVGTEKFSVSAQAKAPFFLSGTNRVATSTQEKDLSFPFGSEKFTGLSQNQVPLFAFGTNQANTLTQEKAPSSLLEREKSTSAGQNQGSVFTLGTGQTVTSTQGKTSSFSSGGEKPSSASQNPAPLFAFATSQPVTSTLEKAPSFSFGSEKFSGTSQNQGPLYGTSQAITSSQEEALSLSFGSEKSACSYQNKDRLSFGTSPSNEASDLSKGSLFTIGAGKSNSGQTSKRDVNQFSLFSFGSKFSSLPDASETTVLRASGGDKSRQISEADSGEGAEEYKPPKLDEVSFDEPGAIFSTKCSCFMLKDDTYKKFGTCILFIKKLDDRKILLVRMAATTGNVILNSLIDSNLKCLRANDKKLRITCVNDSVVGTYLLCFVDNDISKSVEGHITTIES